MFPEIQYCTTGDGVQVAFWAAGQGYPLLLVNAPLPNHLEKEWEVVKLRRWYESLSQHCMVIRYNPRGFGLSQRNVVDVSRAAQHLDIDAVLDALEVEQVAILGESLSVPIVIDYSVAHPAKVSHVILWNGVASAADFFSAPIQEALRPLASRDWRSYIMAAASANRAWSRPNEVLQIANMCVESTSSDVYVRFLDSQLAFDATPLLPSLRSPTLILEPNDAPTATVARNRFLAARIPNSELEIVGIGQPRVFESEDSADHAIRFIAEGSPKATENGTVADEDFFNYETLTQRERQVLDLLMVGCSNQAIMEKLNISIHTVERHLANVYNKLGVHSRIQAIFHVRRLQDQGP